MIGAMTTGRQLWEKALAEMKKALPCQQTCARHTGFSLQFGEHDGRVSVHHIERIFSHSTLHGLKNRVACLGQGAAENHHFGIQQVDESRQVAAQFLSDLFHELDAKQVFPIGCIDDIFQAERGFVFKNLLR